jgi:hypothetical protein
LLSVFLLYLIIQFWPSSSAATTATTNATTTTNATSPVSLFAWKVSISDDARLLLIVTIAGALGSLLHGLRSIYWYYGNRDLITSWYPKYLLLPVSGAIIGLLTYLLLRGGLFALQATTSTTTPFAFAAVSGLMGLFSEQAITKLKQIFEQLFTPPPKGADQSNPVDQSKPGAAKPEEKKPPGEPKK